MLTTLYYTIINRISLIFIEWIDVEDIKDSLAKMNGTVTRHGTNLDGH